jgi:hypothetical protein
VAIRKLFALLTLAALVALVSSASLALGGQPGSGAASLTIASKICVQIRRDLGRAGFQHAFGTLRACEKKAEVSAEAAVRSCLRTYQPGTDGWRSCIQSHVASAARSLEAKRR